eukprot:764451-Hanusia_phi.AAC.4
MSVEDIKSSCQEGLQHQQPSVLISPTSETLNVNTTFVNESEVSFIMPTVEFVEGFYQIEVLQGNVLLPLIASHCLQFNLIGEHVFANFALCHLTCDESDVAVYEQSCDARRRRDCC